LTRKKRFNTWHTLAGMLRKAFTLLKGAWNRFANPDLSRIRNDPVARATLGFVRSPYTQMQMYMHGKTTGGLAIPFVFGDGYHTAEEIKALIRESQADYDRRRKLTKQKNAQPAPQTEQNP